MLDEREIDAAIAELEYRESSFSNYAKLANLYTIKNQMQGNSLQQFINSYAGASYERAYSSAAAPEAADVGSNDSRFLKAVAGKEGKAAWAVMDELMDTLQVVNPRVYESVMRKINNL